MSNNLFKNENVFVNVISIIFTVFFVVVLLAVAATIAGLGAGLIASAIAWFFGSEDPREVGKLFFVIGFVLEAAFFLAGVYNNYTQNKNYGE